MKNKKVFYKSLFICLFVVALLGVAQSAFAVSLANPLRSDDPRELIGFAIRGVLGIAGSLALAVFILGGFMWLLSGGNAEKVKKGRDMLVWASLGLAVIFFSYTLVRFIFTTLLG